MKILLLAFLSYIIIPVHGAENGNTLKTFVTDGCTLFVDGTNKQPDLWFHCCEEHDMRYWFGGTQFDMDKTDLRLKSCVNDMAGEFWAELIYAGVRAGHSSPVKNKSQWSWGWKNERSNNPLNASEINYIKEELWRLPYDREVIENFIKLNFPNKNAKI